MAKTTVVHNIYQGAEFYISPSRGFLGIEPGAVEVIGIRNYHESLDAHLDVKDIIEADPETLKDYWILYSYVDDMVEMAKVNEFGRLYVLPIGLFSEHISVW